LQDNHRAVLLGSKTFGESSIETVIPVPGNGAIRLTTARFMTPTGRQIQGKGIEPDLAVMPLKLERLGQLDRYREVDLRGALKNTDPTVARGEPASSLSPAATAISAVSEDSSATTGDIGSGDEQLSQAMDVLRGLALVSGRAVQ